jgi:hypothetical protein
MRKLILAVAAALLTTAGCRMFRDDHPSHSYYDPPPAVLAEGPKS